MDARERIAALWAAPPSPLGMPGFAIPDLLGFEWHPIGDAGTDNWVVAAPGSNWRGDLKIEVSLNLRGNVIVYGKGSRACGLVRLLGHENLLICGEDNPYHFNFASYFSGNRGQMFIGARATSNDVSMWTHGDDTKVIIGEDAMIAHGVLLRTSDDHAIVDLKTGHHLNPPQSIHIDPHVWLCPEVHVLKGVRIGFGSIIGERSTVTGPIGQCTLATGVPARPLREGVSWDRPLYPRPDIHDTIKSLGLAVAQDRTI